MKSINTICKLVALILIIIMLTGCSASEAVTVTENAADAAAPAPSAEALEKHQKQVFAMDTVMILTAYGPPAEEALSSAEALIAELEADLDPESETGSVYALNAGSGAQIMVSRDCYNVMSTTMEYWHASGGALDPGIYPLSKAWGFIGGDYRVPDAAEINGLLSAKNTGGILMDESACAAEIPAGMEVSFGAVAKGYTAQAVIELMREAGVTSAILSLGGNVQTLGETKPDGSQWQVAVQDPRDTGSYVGVLSVGEKAVVTSGGYQRYFVEDGVTYIHILDPETGYPVDNDLLSVTVVTEDGAAADALSTTLFVLGKDGALDFYEEYGGFEAVLITKDDGVIITPGLDGAFTGSGTGYDYYMYNQ